jgi:hypothetical protein
MKLFNMYTLAALSLLAVAPVASAQPGEAANVTIERLQLSKQYGNLLFIRLTTLPTVRTGCSQNGYWHFTLDIGDALGKNMYAQLLIAHASGQRVDLGGDDSCGWGDVESLRGVALRL